MRRRALLFLLACGAAATGALADRLEDTFYVPLDHPAIRYAQAPNDPVARLEKRLESGQAKLDFAANGWGYLPSVLQQLGINADSQILVFSKTSIQLPHISPRTPRALYFNDEVAVGYVQNGDVLELTSLDPKQGVILYTLDTEKSASPEFTRRDDCLKCHQGPVTLGVPGILISSVHPRSSEAGDGHGSAYETDQRIEIKDRWGGWYVTGTHGAQTHLGNNPALMDPLQPGGPAGPGALNLTSLAGLFDTSRYLAPTSDIVALLTIEHQVRMTNLMIRIGWDARIAQHDNTLGTVRPQLDSEIEEMVGYMLYADEAPLGDTVAGVSTFTKTFAARGPRDRKGRSLRDFDLHTRLFRYPLSYLIYSAAFDGMPDLVKERVYQRLYDVLSGKDQSKPFARLSAADRAAVLEIVRETKPNLPAYWAARTQ
ncbi:MAG: hypothetical protein LAP40_24645 [Acidobacteriia bacterium]|nr:hypothetical protein [Terriglobia bacterium]